MNSDLLKIKQIAGNILQEANNRLYTYGYLSLDDVLEKLYTTIATFDETEECSDRPLLMNYEEVSHE